MRDAPLILAGLGHVCGAPARKRGRPAVLRELTKLSNNRSVSLFDIAMVYARLGKKFERKGACDLLRN